ncbi:hypothetical protein ACI4AF_28500, partial [Klebsiella pneumoniae]|uniref:hypothetical protein n=1 Tax=Klebsiella pneumoniae TaxID=573 RepID=UPI003852C4F0
MIRARGFGGVFRRSKTDGFSRLMGDGSGFVRHSRAGYVGAGRRLVAMALNTPASGHADAKATRMRE